MGREPSQNFGRDFLSRPKRSKKQRCRKQRPSRGSLRNIPIGYGFNHQWSSSWPRGPPPLTRRWIAGSRILTKFTSKPRLPPPETHAPSNLPRGAPVFLKPKFWIENTNTHTQTQTHT